MDHPEPPFSRPIPTPTPSSPPPQLKFSGRIGTVGWGAGAVLSILSGELGPWSIGKKPCMGTDELVAQAKWSKCWQDFCG